MVAKKQKHKKWWSHLANDLKEFGFDEETVRNFSSDLADELSRSLSKSLAIEAQRESLYYGNSDSLDSTKVCSELHNSLKALKKILSSYSYKYNERPSTMPYCVKEKKPPYINTELNKFLKSLIPETREIFISLSLENSISYDPKTNEILISIAPEINHIDVEEEIYSVLGKYWHAHFIKDLEELDLQGNTIALAKKKIAKITAGMYVNHFNKIPECKQKSKERKETAFDVICKYVSKYIKGEKFPYEIGEIGITAKREAISFVEENSEIKFIASVGRNNCGEIKRLFKRKFSIGSNNCGEIKRLFKMNFIDIAEYKEGPISANLPLNVTSRVGSKKIVSLLLEKGMNVNLGDWGDCDTLLHWAAGFGYLETVKVLVENEANINARNIYGLTPLHYSARRGQLEVTKFLIEKGADINAKDKNSFTPLHWSAKKKCLEVTKFLIEKGADINAKDKYESTPLHWSAKKKCLEVTKCLIEKGADINAKDEYGLTPLHWSAKKKYLEVTKCLIEKGADINARSKDGLRPRKLAHKKNPKIIELFQFKIKEINYRIKAQEKIEKNDSVHYDLNRKKELEKFLEKETKLLKEIENLLQDSPPVTAAVIGQKQKDKIAEAHRII